jgi:hypothetical protein
MKHEEFQKIAEAYAEEHGLEIFFASWKDNNLNSFGTDKMQDYFHGLIDDRKELTKYYEKHRSEILAG